MQAGKRFYDRAEAVAGDGHGEGDGFAVHLDGRPVRTPGRRILLLPTRALAEAVAAEWAAQEEDIRPHGMPLTQLACTALDAVPEQRADMERAVLRYAETDLLCYRADPGTTLAARQEAAWRPLLEWAAARFGATLTVTVGIMPVRQPAAALEALAAPLRPLDAPRFTALQAAAPAAGSLVLALALLEGRLDAEATIAAAELDEAYQEELWGSDPEQVERRERRANDLRAAARLLSLLE